MRDGSETIKGTVSGNQGPDAGWYDDPDGVPNNLRYWDGTRWTEHFWSATPAPPPVPPAPVTHAAPAAVASDPVASSRGGTAERVQAIIPGTKLESGFMRLKGGRHTLILTDRRVIFARSTMAMMKQRFADARDGAKPEDAGLLDRLDAQMNAYLVWEYRYLTMPPDQALAETAHNFAVERLAITKTALKTRRVRGQGYVDIDDLLVIRTHGKKYVIRLFSGRHQAKHALKAAGMI